MNAKAKFWLAAIALASALLIPFEKDVKTGYIDPVGIPTAGVGHTGSDVVVGKFYEDAIREKWLNDDLSEAAAIVERCAPKGISVYQAAAYISFAFNVGPGKKGVKDGFCVLKSGKQPTFLIKAWRGDVIGSCNGLLAWDKAKGKNLRGLTRRRIAERDMCVKGEE